MNKSALIITLMFLALVFTANAQPRFSPQDRLERLTERLNLTNDQVLKVEKILAKADKEIQTLRSSEKMDRSEFRKIMDKTNQEIEKVLNDKQKSEFKKMLEERRKPREEKSSRSVN